MGRLDLDRIRGAVGSIDPVFLRSPQFESPPLSHALGCALQLKVETMNPVRSFKGRGTETVLSRLLQAGDHRPVVCASAGNLGEALAFCAGRRDVPVTVFAATTASPMKVERMRALGARVHLEGEDIEVPRQLAAEHAAAGGAHLVEDSLDVGTCEGAATIALELMDAGVALDVVVLALGGGALATGVGYVLRQLSPRTEVIAVQPVGAAAMALSWRQRRVVTTDTVDTIADGVAGRFPIPEVLADLLEVVDDTVLVGEERIRDAMRVLVDLAGLVVEPAAALGVAAILQDQELGERRFRDRRVATVVCGSNVAPSDFRRWTAAPACDVPTAMET